MIWGAMSFKGTDGVYFLPPRSTTNSEQYLLKSKLVLYMKVHNCDVFIHDGAPCHRKKVVKNFLKQKPIKMLEWPRNSPDLNPTENLWNFTKKKVSEKHPSNLDALQTAIKKVWVRDITPDYCCKLMDSMPRHLQAVIKNKCGHTKY